MKRKHKRLTFVVIALALLGIAAGLVLYGFSEGIAMFKSPTDILAEPPEDTQRLRLGGLVEELHSRCPRFGRVLGKSVRPDGCFHIYA